MSGFIGAAQPQFILREHDQSLNRRGFLVEREAPLANPTTFATPWWPRSGFCGDTSADVGVWNTAWTAWDTPELTEGTNSRFGYAGITRDAAGAPLAGVTVKIFGTADDLKKGEDVVSDVNGAFVASTPNYLPHWLYMRKTGTPDVGGVSVSTSYPNT